MIDQQKNNRTLYHQNQDLTEKPVTIFKIQMHFRIILKFFEKYKCTGIAFFLQSTRYVSNEQSCLKTTGLYDYLYFYLDCFTFSISYSVLLSFTLCSPISPTLLFLCSFSAFIKCNRKVYIYTHICIFKNINFCLTKKIITF